MNQHTTTTLMKLRVLRQNDVYRHKSELLSKNHIAVWRFHDYWHRNEPDGILMGVLVALNWQKYYDASNPHVIKIPPLKLSQINDHLKKSLGISTLRLVG